MARDGGSGGDSIDLTETTCDALARGSHQSRRQGATQRVECYKSTGILKPFSELFNQLLVSGIHWVRRKGSQRKFQTPLKTSLVLTKACELDVCSRVFGIRFNRRLEKVFRFFGSISAGVDSTKIHQGWYVPSVYLVCLLQILLRFFQSAMPHERMGVPLKNPEAVWLQTYRLIEVPLSHVPFPIIAVEKRQMKVCIMVRWV